jgi:hypothetical protein
LFIFIPNETLRPCCQMTIIMTSSNYYEVVDAQVGRFCCLPKTPETWKLNEKMTPSDIIPPLFRPRHIEHRHNQEEINKEGLNNEAYVISKTLLLLNIEDSDEADICTPNGRHTRRGEISLLALPAPRKATFLPKCIFEHSATEDHCHYSLSVTLRPRLTTKKRRLSYDNPQEDSKQEENILLFQDKQEDCIPLLNRSALSGKEEEDDDEGEQLNDDRKKLVQSKLPGCVLLPIQDDDDDTIDYWSKNKNKSTNVESIRHSFPSSNFHSSADLRARENNVASLV